MKGVSLTPLDLTRVSPPPGGGEKTFRARTARRIEGLRAEGGFSDDVQSYVTRILENAMNAGALHAIVQTLRLNSQYTYVLNENTPSDEDTFIIRHIHTMVPLDGVRARVRLASAPYELVQWLRSKELDVAICTRPLTANPGSARVPIADWLQIVAIFVPSSGSIFSTRLSSEPGVAQWMARLNCAANAGKAYFVNAILYVGADFGRATAASDSALAVAAPLQHPTMLPLQEPAVPKWALSERYAPMCAWVASLSFSWTLSAPSVASTWALFLVFLDPPNTYQ